MKNKEQRSIWTGLFLIIIIGFLLRIWGIYKEGGLTNDELDFFVICNQPNLIELVNRAFPSLHFPLPNILFHYWMKLFGIGDEAIRMFSVLIGTSAIYIAFLIGKELKSNALGLVMSSLLAINSFAIFYSQQVRFYILAMTISFLVILAVIRFLKTYSLKNLAFLCFSTLLLLFTINTAEIFVFCETIAILSYLYFDNKTALKNTLYAGIITFILYSPKIFWLLNRTATISSQNVDFWELYHVSNNLNFNSILVMFQQWFSPLIVSLPLITNPPHDEIINGYFASLPTIIIYTLFVLIPVSIVTFGLSRTNKNKFAYILLFIAVFQLIIEAILTMNGKFALISRYAILVFTPLFVNFIYGIFSCENKLIPKILIPLLIICNLSYAVLLPNSFASNIPRGNFRYLSSFLKEHSTPGTKIYTHPGWDIKTKYLSELDTDFIQLHDLRPMQTTPELKEQCKKYNNKEKSYCLYKDYFASPKVNKNVEQLFRKKVYEKLQEGETFILALADYRYWHKNEEIINIASSKDVFFETPLWPLQDSKFCYNLETLVYKYLKNVKKYKINSWQIFIGKKADN